MKTLTQKISGISAKLFIFAAIVIFSRNLLFAGAFGDISLTNLNLKNMNLKNIAQDITKLSAAKKPAQNIRELSEDELNELIESSVVKIDIITKEIDVNKPYGEPITNSTCGSGFVIDFNGEKVILTNAHVATNYHSDIYVTKTISRSDSPRKPAKLKFIANDVDLALLEVKDKSFFVDLIPLKFGEEPYPLQRVIATGFPARWQNKIWHCDENVTKMTRSVIAITTKDSAHAKRPLKFAGYDAIVGGMSGGAVIDHHGMLVGVNDQGDTNTASFIPLSYVKRFLEDIKDGKYDGLPDLGIYKKSVNSELKTRLGVPQNVSAVQITKIEKGSPAEIVGLKTGDLITEINHCKVTKYGDVCTPANLVADFHCSYYGCLKGDGVQIEYYREGENGAQNACITFDDNGRFIAGCKADEKIPNFIFGGMLFNEERFYKIGDYSYSKRVRIQRVYQNEITQEQNLQGYKDWIISKINSQDITDIESAREALSKGKLDSFQIELKDGSGNSGQLFLELETAKKIDKAVIEEYKMLPKLFLIPQSE